MFHFRQIAKFVTKKKMRPTAWRRRRRRCAFAFAMPPARRACAAAMPACAAVARLACVRPLPAVPMPTPFVCTCAARRVRAARCLLRLRRPLAKVEEDEEKDGLASPLHHELPPMPTGGGQRRRIR
jgi:hypothetical protein